MFKRPLIPLLVLLAIVAVFFGFRSQSELPNHKAESKRAPRETVRRRSLVVDSDGKARAFYAIVERDGVYFGDQRVDFEIANAFMEEIAKKEKIFNICVEITGLVRFGDAIHFYFGIDRSKYYVTSFPVRTVPTGYRLPLIGHFQLRIEDWYDETNGMALF